jgi:Na+-translocating ferredoxin:NAD+ oxidoreductase RnfG subunit
MRFALAAAAIASAAAPTSVFAIDYMTADEAAKLMFPDADSFDARTVTLDAAQLRQLNEQGVRGRSANWPIRVARHGNTTLGFVVTDNVIGKVELITYAVGIALDDTVKQVEILSYRESHGYEIRLPAWRKQFAGKGAESALRIGDDIQNISGATLSCTHVTEGIRRIVAVMALAHRSGALA